MPKVLNGIVWGLEAVLIVLLVFMLGAKAQAASWSVDVGTTSVVIAPDIQNAASLATIRTNGTTYAAGTYVSVSGKPYWTPNGGTSTVAPSHRSGIVTESDGVSWVYCGGSGRTTLEISLIDIGEIYIERSGADAVAGQGTLLLGKGSAAEYVNYRGEVNAVALTGIITVGVQEL